MRVAYLGPQGTYSQEAAAQHFSDGFESIFCDSLAGVVDSVVCGRAEYAVLPIENSTNGPVNLALDALLFFPGAAEVEVDGEVRVAVRHQLYSRARSLAQIDTVYSHPQVWGQVAQWLRKHLPQARCVDCDSTAAAVARALAPPPPPSSPLHTRDAALTPPAAAPAATTAALGGPLTTDAAPLVADCADNPTNTTRFLVLRRRSAPPRRAGAARGETVVAVAHNTRAAPLVAALASQGLAPKFIAPRPARGDWEYSYFVELDGAGAAQKAQALGFSIIGQHD